jgi:hypothetical protein
MKILENMMEIFDEIGSERIGIYFYKLNNVFTLKELINTSIDIYDENTIEIFDLLFEYLKYQSNNVEFDLNNKSYKILNEKLNKKDISELIVELLYLMKYVRGITNFINGLENLILKYSDFIKNHLNKTIKKYIYDIILIKLSKLELYFDKFKLSVNDFLNYVSKDKSTFNEFLYNFIVLDNISKIKNKKLIKYFFKEILKRNCDYKNALVDLALKNKFLLDDLLNSDCLKFDENADDETIKAFWNIIRNGDKDIFVKMIDLIFPGFFEKLNYEESIRENENLRKKFNLFIDILLTYKCETFFKELSEYIRYNNIDNDCSKNMIVLTMFDI